MKRSVIPVLAVLIWAQAAMAATTGDLFVVPKEWTLMPGPDSNVTSFQTRPNKEEALLVIVRPIKAPGQSAMQWAQGETAAVEKQGFSLVDAPAEASVDGKSFVRMTSSTDLAGFDLRNEQYFCAYPGRDGLLEVAVMGPRSFFEAERGRIEAFLSSMKAA